MNKIERKIIKKVQKGNKDAFRSLLELYEHRVYAFVLRIVHDQHLAEDITQETFLSVYRSLHTYDDTKVFSTWIFTIAKHAAFRAVKKEAVYDYDAEIDDSSTESIERQVIVDENSRCLLKAIDDINPKYQEVIHLKYFSDQSYKEISETLGISVKKVENRLFAAKKALGQLLDGEDNLRSIYEY